MGQWEVLAVHDFSVLSCWGGDGVSTVGGLGDGRTFSFAACNLARKLSVQNNRNYAIVSAERN